MTSLLDQAREARIYGYPGERPTGDLTLIPAEARDALVELADAEIGYREGTRSFGDVLAALERLRA